MANKPLFKTDGVLTTFGSSIPVHHKFDQPLLLLTERIYNSKRHRATHISVWFKNTQTGDIFVHYTDDGDGNIDSARFTSPQTSGSGGSSVFAAGCHFHRLSNGDPTFKWVEEFKKEGSQYIDRYEGPFRDDMRVINVAPGPDEHFKTRASHGMTGQWLIRKGTPLSYTMADAKKFKLELVQMAAENLSEIFRSRFSQEFFATTAFTIGAKDANDTVLWQDRSTPQAPWKSLETLYQQHSEQVYRFPSAVKVDGDTHIEYEFYRMKRDAEELPGFRHYGHRSLEESIVFIQQNTGFGQHTIEDMPTIDACGLHGGGAATALSGSVAFIKFSTHRTVNGYPDTSCLFKTMAVKVQVHPQCPLIQKHVFEALKGKHIPKGWKETKSDKVDAAPKWSAPAPTPTVLVPQPQPKAEPQPQPQPEAAPQQPQPEPKLAIQKLLSADKLTYTRTSDKVVFTYTEPSRKHDPYLDVCKLAADITCIIKKQEIPNTGYSIRWVADSVSKTEALLEMFKPMFSVFLNCDDLDIVPRCK